MTWRDAFFRQAKSDNEVRKLLNKKNIEYAHQLHYLQMVTEKLAKGLLTSASSMVPPKFEHKALVSCLQTIKCSHEIRRRLGYENKVESFKQFIDSLLPIANNIEKLAPSFAGKDQPNPEYPWQCKHNKMVYAPADFNFPDFHPKNPQLIKLVELVDRLLKIIA